MKHYFISDFDLAPVTVRKRAKRLDIEQKTKEVYWSTRKLIYFTQAEFDMINAFDYVEFKKSGRVTEKPKCKYKKWAGYTCKCGVHNDKTKETTRVFTWGIKDECIKCRHNRTLEARRLRQLTTSEKISNYFMENYTNAS